MFQLELTLQILLLKNFLFKFENYLLFELEFFIFILFANLLLKQNTSINNIKLHFRQIFHVLFFFKKKKKVSQFNPKIYWLII